MVDLPLLNEAPQPLVSGLKMDDPRYSGRLYLAQCRAHPNETALLRGHAPQDAIAAEGKTLQRFSLDLLAEVLVAAVTGNSREANRGTPSS